MMPNRRKLVLEAADAALRVRQSAGIALTAPVCVYDLAHDLGVDVRFFDTKSMEGMYMKAARPTIIVSSLRPRGRQVFTCAHELGHHVFKHGTHLDHLVNEVPTSHGSDDKEFLADLFAGLLLMPKSTVAHALARRRWNAAEISPVQVYLIACWLGVGYTTLIHHMSSTLGMITTRQGQTLLKVPLKRIRRDFLQADIADADSDLIVVDENWTDRAIDVAVGDDILVPTGTTHSGQCIARHPQVENVNLFQPTENALFTAETPGLGRLENIRLGWSAFIRVSSKGYVGRAVYRHLEETDDE